MKIRVYVCPWELKRDAELGKVYTNPVAEWINNNPAKSGNTREGAFYYPPATADKSTLTNPYCVVLVRSSDASDFDSIAAITGVTQFRNFDLRKPASEIDMAHTNEMGKSFGLPDNYYNDAKEWYDVIIKTLKVAYPGFKSLGSRVDPAEFE